MKKNVVLIVFLLVLAVSLSGCVDFLNQDPGQQREDEAEAYAEEINASTYNGNGFSFNYPRNWVSYNVPEWTVTLGDPNDNSTYIYVDTRQLAANETAKGLLDQAIAEIQADSTRNITIVSRESITISNVPYNIVVVNEVVDGNEIKYIQAWLENNKIAYLLGGVSTPQRFEEVNKTFSMFIYSFEFE
ncbi:MAG: PsbP-related protein [Methanomicrobiales archaeon]